MKTVGEVRLENLEALVREFGTLDAVATRAESTSVYLSQLRNGTPDQKTGKSRQMGNAIARRLEAACGKPPGWMDASHTENEQGLIGKRAQGADPGFVAAAVPVIGGVRIDDAHFVLDPSLGSGYVLALWPEDNYAVRIVGTARDRSLRDGQYLIVQKTGDPFVSEFCILETKPGVRDLVELLGIQNGRASFEVVVSGARLSRDLSEIASLECVVAVVSGRRWRAAMPLTKRISVE
jgi:hypothetical protein